MKKITKGILLAMMLVLMALLLAACDSDNNNDQDGPIRIGAITSLSGALQDYGEQFQRGFLLGLEYMTDGTMQVAGRDIEVIWEDTTTTPEVARDRTLVLLETHNVDIVTGFAASGDALASLALFEEFQTVAVIEPAASDLIISYPNWNPYVFRTGRTSGQDALALAAVLANQHPGGGRTVAALAPDSTFGFSMVDPFIPAVQAHGFDFIQAEFAPPGATDFSPFILRLRELAPDYLYVIWAGANNPWMQLMELDLESVGTTIITGAPELAALQGMLELGHMGGFGFCVYYPTLPQNEPMNEWMIARHWEEYGIPTDIFTSGGFAAASAIITALELTEGNTDSDLLIETMRGMEFNSPTGTRYFRAEDHQAIQPLFEIKFTYVPGVDHMVPEFVRTIPASEIVPPIMNRP
ncbi:MAG: substrate-binding domain-containing protein [Defluviitaleaceae bacterium]|nr:substrate-binding domain-containing protein [Defluviitaleaceae bacterium]